MIICQNFSINLELFVEKINIHHAFKLYSHDLFLYSPVKTDVCKRCATYDREKSPKSKQVREKHNIHVKEADHMKLRMTDAERNCGTNVVTVDKATKRKIYYKGLQGNMKKPEPAEPEPAEPEPAEPDPAEPKPAEPEPEQSKDEEKDNVNNAESSTNTEKASHSKQSTTLTEDPVICDDSVAHIATDMMQIQNLPKLPINFAYYKSKVTSQIIIPILKRKIIIL